MPGLAVAHDHRGVFVYLGQHFQPCCLSMRMFSAHLAFHYRKRGSASYIVREVLSVRERERERERERDTEREREREREKDGSDVTIVALKLAMNTLSLAKNSHNWR